MAQTDPAKTGKSGRRRGGGRTKGTWVDVQPEKIRAFRDEHRISRVMLAKALGVSSTTVQNWETNVGVAVPKMQTKLAEILAAGPSAVQISAASLRGSGGGGSSTVAEVIGHQVSTTGMIVNAYLASQANAVSPEELVELIGAVRKALGSSPV